MSLVFRVCARLCAVPLEHVIETMRPLAVEPAPGAPRCVRGLALIRGVPVPVVDVERLLGDETPGAGAAEGRTRPSPRFVTVRVAGRTVALAVDDVIGVRPLSLASLVMLPPLLKDAGADVIDRIGMLDAELLLVLRSARLVPERPLVEVGAESSS